MALMWLVNLFGMLVLGWFIGCIYSEWDNRRWARRHGWCPECGRHVVPRDEVSQP